MIWNYYGQKRPDFAIEPKDGQESVWDYPRPPTLKQDKRHIEIFYKGETIASTKQSIRILETASPPTFYLPLSAVNMDLFEHYPASSFCEWKGSAIYWNLKSFDRIKAVAWSYPLPSSPFALIKDYFSFYPRLLDCYIDGELVRSQPGRFYGGWVTDDVVGPFKGEAGTEDW